MTFSKSQLSCIFTVASLCLHITTANPLDRYKPLDINTQLVPPFGCW